MIHRMAQQERVGRGVAVQQLKDHYRVRVRHPRYDGGRERYPYKGKDLAQVRAWASKLSQKLEADAKERTVGDALSAFETQYLPTIRKLTEEQWERDIRNHIKPLLGDVPLVALSRERLFQFGEEALRDRSKWIVKRCYTILRRAIRWYWIENEIEHRNPAELVLPAWEALRLRHHLQFEKRGAWSRDEATIILDEARKLGGPIYPLLLLSLGTGLRLGELQGVQWRDIEWERGFLWVRRSVDARGRVGPCKSGKERIVDLSDQSIQTLRGLRGQATSMQWVFATRSGRPIGRKRLYGEPSKDGKKGRGFALVRELAAKRGVSPDRTIHSARHSFASLAIESGQDDEWIRQQLGHHSSDYTRRAYAHTLNRRRDLSFAEFEVSG